MMMMMMFIQGSPSLALIHIGRSHWAQQRRNTACNLMKPARAFLYLEVWEAERNLDWILIAAVPLSDFCFSHICSMVHHAQISNVLQLITCLKNG